MNEIVVYQPNEVTRPEVRVDHNMTWLNRHQLSMLFGRDIKTIGKHIANAFKEELSTERTNNQVVAKFATTATDGKIYRNRQRLSKRAVNRARTFLDRASLEKSGAHHKREERSMACCSSRRSCK